ncbi:MAG: helix-turn-helix domain-containing protein [Bacteroidetes bacterium]|jgi:excisionase family DNA binding protein|nr:MAG: helix-turn-helix domain-containing protein [Bacteroidota bacterium]
MAAPNPFTEINDRLDMLTQMVAELMKKPSPNSTHAADTPLNAVQAAKYVNMAVNTIYILTSKRQIPHFKRGKRIYFYKEELDNWLKANRRKTVEEIESEA